MKTFLLIYVFSLASGDVLEAEDMLIKTTPATCERIAVEKQVEQQRELLKGNGLLQGITVKCQEVRR